MSLTFWLAVGYLMGVPLTFIGIGLYAIYDDAQNGMAEIRKGCRRCESGLCKDNSHIMATEAMTRTVRFWLAAAWPLVAVLLLLAVGIAAPMCEAYQKATTWAREAGERKYQQRLADAKPTKLFEEGKAPMTEIYRDA